MLLSSLACAQTSSGKQPPPGFAASAAPIADRTLYWQGRARGAMVFIARDPAAGTYVLTPAAIPTFRRFLIGIGIEPGAAASYAERPSFTVGATDCLPLAAAPLDCVDIGLQLKDSDYLELITGGAKARSAPELLSQDVGLIGSTLISVGATRLGATDFSPSSVSGNLSALTRGIVARGERRLEYDLGLQGSYTNAVQRFGNDRTDGSFLLNLLAASTPFGAEGRAFGGAFRTASPTDLLAGSSTYFFARPTALGLAYKSNGEAFGLGGQRHRVRVQLATTSLVRIVSRGITVAEGTYGAGDQFIPFSGFTDGFVDVIIRDSSGREQTERAQVLPDTVVSLASLASERYGPHFFYVDAGQVLNQGGGRDQSFGLESDATVTGIYTYTGAPEWVVQVGTQWIGSLARLGATLGDARGQYRLTANVGTGSELGMFLSAAPRLGFGVNLSGTYTWYQPPKGSRGFTSTECLNLAFSPCYSLSRFESLNVNLGYTGFPISVGYLSTKTGVSNSQLVLAQGTFGLPWLVRGATLIALGSYQPNANSYSVSMTLVLPLDFATNSSATGTASTDSTGTVSGSAGLSASFSEEQYQYLRAASLSANYSQGGAAGTRGSLSSTAQAQLGPVNSTMALAGGTDGSASLFGSFNSFYAVTERGIAFNRSTADFPLIDPFAIAGPAGIAVFNRSNEPQTVIAGSRSVSVGPRGNIFLPLQPGLLTETVVAPGPPLNGEDIAGPVYLHKGNLRSVVVAPGLWVVARFTARPSPDTDDGVLRPEYTFLSQGDPLERIYPDSRGAVLLFELLPDEPTIERYVVMPRTGNVYGCVAPAPTTPAGEYVYPSLTYRCTPASSKAEDRAPAAAKQP
jgi:hypothetical protein